MNEQVNSGERDFFSMLFSFKGRMNRQEYFIYGVLIAFIFAGLGFYMLFSMGQGNVSLLPILLGSVIQLASSVRRARDINENIAVVVIALLLPYISFLVVLYLLIAPSKVLEEGSVKKSRTVLYLLLAFLVVIMIGLVSAVLLPKFMASSNEDIREKLVCVKMKSVSNDLKMFKLDMDSYPSTEEGFEFLLTNSYLSNYPLDSWGHELKYIHKGDDFELISYGRDGYESNDDITFSQCDKGQK